MKPCAGSRKWRADSPGGKLFWLGVLEPALRDYGMDEHVRRRAVVVPDILGSIEDSPGEVASMKARAELMNAIIELIRKQGLTQAEAAKRLGVTQPRAPRDWAAVSDSAAQQQIDSI